MKKIGFVSLGCPKNLVDSEVMMGMVREAGDAVTSNPAEADVIVVNTCAFIDPAKKESIETILEMAQYKKTGSCRRLVVAGCLAERYRDELAREIPEIDAQVGTGDLPEIVSAVGSGSAGLKACATVAVRQGVSPAEPGPSVRPAPAGAPEAHPGSVPAVPNARGVILLQLAPTSSTPALAEPSGLGWRPLPTYLYDADTPRVLATARHTAYVKIAEGCNYRCTFCIIPKLRGNYRSRTPESILREARMLAERGVRELILISQDTTYYGIDRGERHALSRLLRELNRVDGLEWIRLHYLYPTTVTDQTIAAMAECDKVVKYVDLPLQHASDPILRRMNRPGTRKSYERLLATIRAAMPDAALRTTFIAGFPGETDADFAELRDFVNAMAFTHVGVFTYSHEEGTKAYELADHVPAAVKRRRQRRLLADQRAILRRRQRALRGRRSQMLVDGVASLAADGAAPAVLHGRLPWQAPDIDGLTYLTDLGGEPPAAGDLLDVEIVGARDYDLVARPV